MFCLLLPPNEAAERGLQLVEAMAVGEEKQLDTVLHGDQAVLGAQAELAQLLKKKINFKF